MLEMHVERWDTPVPVSHGTLLDCGLRAGVPIPNQCRSGECGRCKCELLAGEVRKLDHMPGALSKDEEHNGWILACRCRARSSVRVRFPELQSTAAMVPTRQSAEVLNVERLTHDVVALRVAMERGVDFHAGQYVDLSLPGLPPRSYSPACAPGSGVLEFFVKVLADGLVSRAIASNLPPGTEVTVDGPYGDACMPEPPDAPVLLIGGGTGIAPLLSMARYLSAEAPQTPCHMYFGVRTAADLFANDALACLHTAMPRLRVTRVLSDEEDGVHRSGFLGPALAKDFEALNGMRVFIAGPPAMVEHCESHALRLGAPPSAISADKFIVSEPRGLLQRLVARFARPWSAGSVGRTQV